MTSRLDNKLYRKESLNSKKGNVRDGVILKSEARWESRNANHKREFQFAYRNRGNKTALR